MSFGYSVGDFVLLTQLALQVVQNARKACGAHEELTHEVTSLHLVLRRLEVEVSKPKSILSRSDDSLDRKEELAQLSEHCRRILRVLDRILKKYNALSEEKRSVTKLWKKVKFGNGEMLDLAEIRLKVSTSTSAITLFLNLLSIGSQGKVESYMESQGDELREMRRSLNWITASIKAKSPNAGEGSILTTYAGDDKEIWKDFRRELIKEGFSSDVLKQHKEVIKEYVMELGDRGALDDIETDIKDGKKPLSVTGGSDDFEDLTKQDSVDEKESEEESEGSEQKSERNAEGEPEKKPEEEPENYEKRLQSSTERRSFDENFESNDNEAGLNFHESKLVENQNRSLDGSGPEAPAREDDEHDTSKPAAARVEAHPSIVSRTPSQEANDEESQIGGVTGGGEEVQPLTERAQREPSIIEMKIFSRPLLTGGRDLSRVPDDLFRVLPKWCGPYVPHSTHGGLSTYLWNRLDLPEDMLHNNTIIDQFDPDGITKSLRSFCNWIVAATQTYDQIRISISSKVSSPNLVSPLAIELRLLVLRACANNFRIETSPALSAVPKKGELTWHVLYEFRTRFRKLVKDFYEFIEDSVCHVLSLNEEHAQDSPVKELLTLMGGLAPPEESDEVVTKRPPEAALDVTRIGGRSTLFFVHALFEENDFTTSEHATARKSTLADFVPKVQELLLFFKRYCEDPVLMEEYRITEVFRWPYTFGHSIRKNELLDLGVRDAVSDLRKCEEALNTWCIRNRYANDTFKTRPFSRGTASLSAILESCDDARERLLSARYWVPAPAPLGAIQEGRSKEDQEQSGTRKRGNKK